MAIICTNVNGSFTLLSAKVAVGPAADDGLLGADSFGFGVEREMKESGEKSGAEDSDTFVFENSTSSACAGGWDILKNDKFEGSESDTAGRLLVGTDGGIWRDGLLNFTKVMLKQDPTNGGGADEQWTVVVVTDRGTSLPAVQHGSGDADPFVDPNNPNVELIGLALRTPGPDDFIL